MHFWDANQEVGFRVLYFGCALPATGHSLYDARWERIYESNLPDALKRPDGTMTPYLTRGRGGYVEAIKQPQGHARLNHLWGWSVVAWWDRTVDERMGSNSAFLVEQPMLSFDEVVELGAKTFSAVWKRQTTPLVEVSE